MTTFTIIAALMILVALAMLAPALLRSRQLADSDRDRQNVIIARERLKEMELELAAGKINQEEFDLAKVELEQALLQDLKEEDVPAQVSSVSGKLTLVGIAVAIPVLTIGLYVFLGSPSMVDFDPAKQAEQHQKSMPSVEEMLGSLLQRLKEKPDDAEGWYLLGRTYMVMNDNRKAADAFEKLLKLSGEEPEIMLSLAEALTAVQEGNMLGRPAELMRRSLELAPDSPAALWMNGMMEAQQRNNSLALSHLKKLETMIQGEPEALQRVRTMIGMIEGHSENAEPPPADK